MTLFNHSQLTKEHAKEALMLWSEQFYGKKLLVCKRISVYMSRKSEFRLLFLSGLSHWLRCVFWILWFLKPHISSSLGGSCSWAQMGTANLSLFDLIASCSQAQMPHVREPQSGVFHPASWNAAAERTDQLQRPLFAAIEAGGPVITATQLQPCVWAWAVVIK